jgi:sialate O-acetylesterase
MKRFLLLMAVLTVLILTQCAPLPFLHPTGEKVPVTLSGLFSDHMVLQRNQPVPVWGQARPGSAVTVRLNQQQVTTITDETGQWQAELPAMGAGGPYDLEVAGDQTLIFTDVYVGEVWICSGQSNMEWPLIQANNAEAEIAAAGDPMIRLLTVEKNTSYFPLDDFNTEGWQVCGSETAMNFSAVGYFFGRELARELKLPIGLIHTSWGGDAGRSLDQFCRPESFSGTHRAAEECAERFIRAVVL